MQRLENETFEDYQKRRKQSQLEIKQKLRGRWFHKSELNSPYVKPKGNPKTSFTQDLRNQKGYANHLSKRYSL